VPTKVLAYVDNKQSRVEIDVDASNRVTAIRRIGGRPATVVLGRADGTRTYTLTATQTSLSIATTTANRILLTFDAARNRYSGMAGEVRDG
jgi:hypothetical protein